MESNINESEMPKSLDTITLFKSINFSNAQLIALLVAIQALIINYTNKGLFGKVIAGIGFIKDVIAILTDNAATIKSAQSLNEQGMQYFNGVL